MSVHKRYLKPFQLLILRLLTLPLIILVALATYSFISGNLDFLKVHSEAQFIIPSTAFCFLLVFFATWTILERRSTLTFLLALVLIIISLYSFLHSYYHPIEETITTFHNFYLKPMPYDVALSFLAFAFVLLLLRRKKLRAAHLVLSSILLWIVLSIAQISLFYYVFYHPGITTRGQLSMPFATSVGLVYTVFIYAAFIFFHVSRLYPTALTRWIIVSSIFISITGGYALWKSTKNLESAFFRYLSIEIGNGFKDTIQDYTNEKRSMLENVLFFLEHPTKENQENWMREVSIFIQKNPEIMVIVGYIPEVNNFWEVNGSGSEQKLERIYQELDKYPYQEIIVDDQALSPAFILSNRTHDPSKSWMAVMIDINLLVSKLSDKTLKDKIGIAITWGKSLLYMKHANDQQYRHLYGAKVNLSTISPPIVIEVWPTTKQYMFLKTPLSNIILASELAALILACLIFYYAELARFKGSQYQKAEEEKTAFFANISHEIRTQLQGIMGTGSVLERTELTEKQQKMVHIIKASGNVLQRLLNDLLDLTKFEMGRMKLNFKATCVSQSVREVTTLMTPKAEEKGLKIHLKIDPNLPQTVYLDVDRFEQILSNLISNAIKFTKEGTITVSATTNILEDTSKTMLIVKVTDTGIGIPEHALKRIFDKFYQVHTQHNRSIEGTGLGLSISSMLAQYMNGTLTCQSILNEGSTFTLMIPVDYEAKKRAAE